MKTFVCLALVAVLSSVSAPSLAADLQFISLNMHGYHPMGESDRYLQDRATGKTTLTDSSLFYFSADEIKRGHDRQLTALGSQLAPIHSDFIFLQNVEAGDLSAPKTCATYNENNGDQFGTNSAWRLQQRLHEYGSEYDVALACRGNVAWQTTADTFKKQRPMEMWPDGQLHAVFDYDATPFANGLAVEGTATLISKAWKIQESYAGWLPVESTHDQVFVQFTRVARRTSDPHWLLLVNIEGAYKIQHFEQAITIRQAIFNFIINHPQRVTFAGVVVAGDFNAELYRPKENTGELSTIPWEVSIPGEFSYGPGTTSASYSDLIQSLLKFNRDPKFQPAANLPDTPATTQRITGDVGRLANMAASTVVQGPFALVEQITRNSSRTLCGAISPDLHAACSVEHRTSQLFAGPDMTAVQMEILYSTNDPQHASGVSNKPAIYFRGRLPLLP